jgi:hypothetical protein
VEDINSEGEDHIYDQLRYVCMENPIAAPLIKKPAVKAFDPLSSDEPRAGRYDWIKIY